MPVLVEDAVPLENSQQVLVAFGGHETCPRPVLGGLAWRVRWPRRGWRARVCCPAAVPRRGVLSLRVNRAVVWCLVPVHRGLAYTAVIGGHRTGVLPVSPELSVEPSCPKSSLSAGDDLAGWVLPLRARRSDSASPSRSPGSLTVSLSRKGCGCSWPGRGTGAASPPVPGDAGAEVTDEPVQVISRRRRSMWPRARGWCACGCRMSPGGAADPEGVGGDRDLRRGRGADGSPGVPGRGAAGAGVRPATTGVSGVTWRRRRAWRCGWSMPATSSTCRAGPSQTGWTVWLWS